MSTPTGKVKPSASARRADFALTTLALPAEAVWNDAAAGPAAAQPAPVGADGPAAERIPGPWIRLGATLSPLAGDALGPVSGAPPASNAWMPGSPITTRSRVAAEPTESWVTSRR